MAYCTYPDVNTMTNITSSDVANADVTLLIAEATKILNMHINVRVTRERVLFIDHTRQNKVDGSNTTYYVRNWKKNLADMDNDGDVDTSDITVYLVDTDGNETTATVSSIDADDGQFVLSSAPDSNQEVYVTYEWCWRDPSTPDGLIKLACVYFTAALCYAKINMGRAPQVAFGNFRIYRHIESYDKYFNMAMGVVNQINNRQIDYSESPQA